jgi:hypothetical protein
MAFFAFWNHILALDYNAALETGDESYSLKVSALLMAEKYIEFLIVVVHLYVGILLAKEKHFFFAARCVFLVMPLMWFSFQLIFHSFICLLFFILAIIFDHIPGRRAIRRRKSQA